MSNHLNETAKFILPMEPEPKKRGGTTVVVASLLAALLGAVIGAGSTLAITDRGDRGGPAAEVRVANPVEADGQARSLTGVAGVAATVLPSVVRIDSQGIGRGRGRGTGSGIVFRSDGYIITNDHVVSGAESIEVTLSSGEKLPAKLVGSAAPTDDIAVIKVERTDLVPATLGSVRNMQVGDLAIAVGSPFGLDGTVTAGVISALHRNINFGGGTTFTDAIQTDAPINPGNSGGALANSSGEVIGINTAAVGAAGGSIGVGFAIPIDIAKRDAEQIIATGRASRPYIGIAGDSIPGGGGALISEVVSGGPADQAGLRAGDVITQINDTKIDSMEGLISVLTQLDVNATVKLTYKRDGSAHTLDVQLRARPE